jgi:hypothetical protein
MKKSRRMSKFWFDSVSMVAAPNNPRNIEIVILLEGSDVSPKEISFLVFNF